ncbi:MAG: hypothetical protein J7480_03925 [Microbacteriaceae bacterium]|nr:hypothetical protein [Microbacteriaceae bacterium]
MGEPSPPQLTALVWLVFVEAAVLALATVYLLVELFSADAQDARSAIALTVTTALFAAGVAVLGFGLVRRWVRIRGGVLLWQLLQVAVSIGAFQGLLGPSWTGWLLLLPAVAGIWLLFTRPVTAIFAARDQERRDRDAAEGRG